MRMKLWHMLLKYWRLNHDLSKELNTLTARYSKQQRYVDALCDGLAYRDEQIRFLAEIAGSRLRRMHHRDCDCPICVKMNGLEPLVGIIKGRDSNICLLRGGKDGI